MGFRRILNVYIDGSPVGILVTTFPDEVFRKRTRRYSTAEKAEFAAVVFAISKMKKFRRYRIHSDSANVVNIMSGSRIQGNQDIRKRVERIIQLKGLQIEWKWVPRERNDAGKVLEKIKQRDPRWTR